ncbi:hypothetical protein [Egicoccus halophilus]|uniref:Uncharacterized protein n=1 Tax=Egicoccus halophilus TaxID=1670830 RepID=A0A8J3EUQ6_9ACTN|nr:hypothetical protein [Egicoccus halophilus]GGI08176.1 hypothetical protein GCM10011354_27780 [Egicoccus halophilus]
MRADRGPLLAAGALAVVAGLAAWAIGVDTARSGLVAAVVIVLAAARHLLTEQSAVRRTDRWRPRAVPLPVGTRREVRQLSWRLSSRRGQVSPTAVARLAALARVRLARRGLDLDEPGQAAVVRRLVGTGAYRVLTGDEGRPIGLWAFSRAVDAVERLDATDAAPDAGSAPQGRPTPHDRPRPMPVPLPTREERAR